MGFGVAVLWNGVAVLRNSQCNVLRKNTRAKRVAMRSTPKSVSQRPLSLACSAEGRAGTKVDRPLCGGLLCGGLGASECGPALAGPAHGQRMCCLLDERFPRLHERAVILLGQELAATTVFLATTAASLTIDLTTDCGLMVTRLMHCMERVHWRAPALAHDIVDESLLVGGELKHNRPKWEGCGASSSLVLPPQSLPLEPT